MKKQKGSITLEGAISTLVLMAIILTFSSFMKIVHVHGVVQHALIQTAGEIAQYSYLYSLSGLDQVNNAVVDQGQAGSEAVSSGIDEVELFLENIGNGSLVKPNMDNLNPKELIIALSKALAGELYGAGKTILLNHTITMPLLDTYLPNGRVAFFEKNNVVQDGEFSGIDLGASRYFENPDGYDEIELVAIYQMKVISPIPIFDQVTIVQSAKSRSYFSGDKSAPTSPDQEAEETSVWELSNFERARVITERENIPNNMPQSFKAIRGYDDKTGTASTYITLDLNSDTYKDNKKQILSKLKGKLNKIENFKEDQDGTTSLNASQIKSVDYYVVIPEDLSPEMESAFQAELRKLDSKVELSDGREVKVNIIVKKVK